MKNTRSATKKSPKNKKNNIQVKKVNTRGKNKSKFEEDEKFIIEDDFSNEEEEIIQPKKTFLKKRQREESESLSDDFVADDDSIEMIDSQKEESDDDKLSVEIPEEYTQSKKRKTRGLKLNLIDNYVDSDSQAEEVEDPESTKKRKKSAPRSFLLFDEDEQRLLKSRKKKLTYEELEEINERIYLSEWNLYNSLSINLTLLNHRDTDPKVFLEAARNGSHNFYNTENVDKSNLTQVTQALSVVNVRVFHGRFLGLRNVRYGSAKGVIEVLLPNGHTDKMTFNDEPAYAADANFKLEDDSEQTSMIYYRMACFNPFRGGSYAGVKSDSVVFTESKDGLPNYYTIPFNYNYFNEGMNILQARVPEAGENVTNTTPKM